MNIISPMAKGNGAYIIHKVLSDNNVDYQVCGYNPYWTLLPLILPFLCRTAITTDLVHTAPDYAFFFSPQKTPLVITFHNYVLDSFMNAYSSLLQHIHYKTDLKYYTQKAIHRATTITSVSKFTANLVKKDMGFDGEIKVIYNGVNSELFYPKKQYRQKIVKVLFSGNLTRRKGADLLPLIAERLDKHIEILYTSGLRTKINIHPRVNLRPLGSIPYSLMPSIYQEADILLFPTVREGLPLAVLEAMASGLPVVATNCSSLPELIIKNKGGYLCELGNVTDFAHKLNKLASSPKLRLEMGEFNRTRVEENFTAERMISEYNALFENVAASFGHF